MEGEPPFVPLIKQMFDIPTGLRLGVGEWWDGERRLLERLAKR